MSHLMPSISKATDTGRRGDGNATGREADDDFQSLSGDAFDELEELYQDQLLAVAEARANMVTKGKNVHDARALARENLDDEATERFQVAKRELVHAQATLEEEVRIAEKYEAMAQKEDATASNMRQPTHKDSTPSTSRPRHKLPHLTKYSGRRDEWTTWQLQALLKISADGDAIGDSQDQLAYLYSSMEDEAQNRLTIWVTQAIASGACDAEDFMKAAAAAFADPNEQRNALTKLSSMRQGKNEPLHIFLPRFESTLARAGGLSWTSSLQINYLEQALNDETARHITLLQWSFNTCMFTSLAEYKTVGPEAARPYLTLTHYTDLAKDNGIVFMRGEISQGNNGNSLLSVQHAQLLAMLLQDFYGVTGSEQKRKLLEQFHKNPNEFDVDRLVESVNTIGEAQ